MPIQLMLASVLRKYVPNYNGETGHVLTVDAGSSVLDLIRQLSIPEREIKLIMVNGVFADLEKTLSGDERVAFFPAVGGG